MSILCSIPTQCLLGLHAGHFPIAMGSLELDTEETDVNAVSLLHPRHAQWCPLPHHAQLICDV